MARTRLAPLRQVGQSSRVVLISAPAGYGKSTLAAEWALQDSRGTSWVELGRRDNDPVVLLGHVATALERLGPVRVDLLEELVRQRPRIDDVALPLLAGDLRERDRFLLVLDDVHEVTEPQSRAVLASVVAEVPAGCQLMLVTRRELDIPLGRLRASGDLLEVGVHLLALDERETRAVAASGGLELTEEEAAALRERTEGWAAAVALAAMSMRGRGDGAARVAGLVGTQHEIADYLLEEVLESQPDHLKTFLLGTSILERMSPALCNEVLGVDDAADCLEALVHSNSFVVPLDDNHEWYRYHHLFGDLLRAELVRRRPELRAVYLSRAAGWCEQFGSPDVAFAYAHEVGDLAQAGRVALAHWDAFARRGMVDSMRLWLEGCTDAEIASDAQLSIAATWISALCGDAARAGKFVAEPGRWPLDGPSPDGASSLRSAFANLRATLAPEGIGQMLEDAEFVRASEETSSRWYIGACVSIGLASVFIGRPREAIAHFGEALTLSGDRADTAHIRVVSLGYMAFVANELDEPRDVQRRAIEASELVAEYGLDYTAYSAIAYAARALAHQQHGNLTDAARQLDNVRRARPLLRAFRWANIDLALRCAAISLDLGLSAEAVEWAEIASDALRGYPDAGTLPARLQRLEERIRSGMDFGLTGAELRLLGFLPTYLSLQEIADLLYLSRATVKTQVASIYDKLGVSGRSAAVEVIERSGLR